MSDKNIDEIAAGLQKMEDRESVLVRLRDLQTQKSKARPKAKVSKRNEPKFTAYFQAFPSFFKTGCQGFIISCTIAIKHAKKEEDEHEIHD